MLCLMFPPGEKHPRAKLSDAEVNQIRDLREFHGIPYKLLASRFNAPIWTIVNICLFRRRNWRPE